jgi:hypothetical protein
VGRSARCASRASSIPTKPTHFPARANHLIASSIRWYRRASGAWY